MMNPIEDKLLEAIEMYLFQVDRIAGVDIYTREYQTAVIEQAMGMFKLIEDIAEGSVKR